MGSPTHPPMQLRYSADNLIRGQADLDTVNQKLHDAGYSSTWIGSVTTGIPILVFPTEKHPSPCTAEFFGFDETDSDTSETLTQMVESASSSESNLPGSLSLVSPDSDVPCKSRDCPIIGIPHNIGRYFHNGEQYENRQSPGFEVSLAGVMEEASNAFNRTVPPPKIVEAYLNVKRCREEATKADLDLVREYQKHHLYSPVSTEPSTPWPREQYPHKHGLHGQTPPGNGSYLAEDGVTSVFDRDCGVWSNQTGDGGDDDDEDIVPWAPLRTAATDRVRIRPPISSVFTPNENNVCDDGDEVSEAEDAVYGPNKDAYISLSTMREMPRGRELMSDKLRLQERILQQMANEGLIPAETGQSQFGKWRSQIS